MASDSYTALSYPPEICQARALRRLVDLGREAQLWEIRAWDGLAGVTDDELHTALDFLIRQKIVDSRNEVQFRHADRGRDLFRPVVITYYSIQRRVRGGA